MAERSKADSAPQNPKSPPVTPEQLDKDEVDKRLDDELEGTFPASDPPSLTQEPHSPPAKKRPL